MKLLLLLVVSMWRWTRPMAWSSSTTGERNIITHIKGFDGPLPFTLETGYVEVDETHGVELFYYFTPSERNPQGDPLIVWFSGGPGCSGLNGLAMELGPLRFVAADGEFPRLVYLEDSWTKVSNVLFLDVPVGTGFSYAREAQGLNVSLTETSRQVRIFLQKWLAQHPEFRSNPLYLGGDSYGGYTVTVTALEVANHPTSGLNLVGYMVGNSPGEGKFNDADKVPVMHGMALISDELYEAARRSCRGDYVSTPRNARCSNALQAISKATEDVNHFHILEPTCTFLEWPVHSPLHSRLLVQEEEEEEEERQCKYPYSDPPVWANDAQVRETLGIREGSIGSTSWSLCATLPHFLSDVASTIPYHRNLTRRGYRALVYNGDHDLTITFVGTQKWIRALGYPVVAPWRPWYSNRQVAGYTTEYAYNLTFATVKGAAHMAPQSNPKECLDMLKQWTSPAGSL